jgi:hypothetical protein
MQKFFSIFLLFTLTLFATDALECNVVNEDDIYKIKCKYMTVSKVYDRNISMAWTSPSTPGDDRFKTVLLKAYNKSIYDFRYFDGRADGSWTISATDDSTGQVTTTSFEKQDLNEATTMPEPCKKDGLKELKEIKKAE